MFATTFDAHARAPARAQAQAPARTPAQAPAHAQAPNADEDDLLSTPRQPMHVDDGKPFSWRHVRVWNGNFKRLPDDLLGAIREAVKEEMFLKEMLRELPAERRAKFTEKWQLIHMDGVTLPRVAMLRAREVRNMSGLQMLKEIEDILPQCSYGSKCYHLWGAQGCNLVHPEPIPLEPPQPPQSQPPRFAKTPQRSRREEAREEPSGDQLRGKSRDRNREEWATVVPIHNGYGHNPAFPASQSDLRAAAALERQAMTIDLLPPRASGIPFPRVSEQPRALMHAGRTPKFELHPDAAKVMHSVPRPLEPPSRRWADECEHEESGAWALTVPLSQGDADARENDQAYMLERERHEAYMARMLAHR